MKEQIQTPDTRDIKEGTLSEEQLVDIVTAIGIDERRALTIAAMESDVIYTKAPLHKKVIRLQGQVTHVPINESASYKFCASFLRAGLVRGVPPTPDRNGYGYVKTEKGEKIGSATAGLFLSLSENMSDTTLTELWGQPGAQRIRLKLFRQLLKLDLPTTGTELAKAIGEPQPTVSTHISQLSPRIITYRLAKPGQDFFFQLSPERPEKDPQPFKWSGPRTTEIYNIASTTLSQWISPEAITDILIQRNPKLANADRNFLIKYTRQILTHLEKQKYLKVRQFRHNARSEVSLSDEQRNSLSQLINILDGIQNQNPNVLSWGEEKAKGILSNPRRVLKLLRKIKRGPKEPSSRNPLHEREIDNRLLAILAAHPNVSTSDVKRLYGLQYGKQLAVKSVWKRLNGLREKEIIQGQRVKNRHTWNFSKAAYQRETEYDRQDRKFFKLRSSVIKLWQAGKHEETFQATGVKDAQEIFALLDQKNPRLSYEEIGKRRGVTRERISQVAAKLRRFGIPLAGDQYRPRRKKIEARIA